MEVMTFGQDDSFLTTTPLLPYSLEIMFVSFTPLLLRPIDFSFSPLLLRGIIGDNRTFTCSGAAEYISFLKKRGLYTRR